MQIYQTNTDGLQVLPKRPVMRFIFCKNIRKADQVILKIPGNTATSCGFSHNLENA